MILGPDGRPAQILHSTRKLLRGAGNGTNTDAWPTISDDFRRLVPKLAHRNIVSYCLQGYANIGWMAEAIDGKAIASVGNHFQPVYRGTDPNGKTYEKWLRDEWCPNFEISGSYDWATGKYLESTNIDHSGDIGILFTYKGDPNRPWPVVQYISANRIRLRKDRRGS